MCGIFEFWWNNFFMGMKLNFKFESWENFTKDFPVIFFFMRILCKTNPDQNYREFFCKIFCWRSSINLYGNLFLKFKRNNFRKDFLVKKNQWELSYQNWINVLSDIFFCDFLSEHHSSLNLTTTPHYVLMSSLPPSLPTSLPPYLTKNCL